MSAPIHAWAALAAKEGHRRGMPPSMKANGPRLSSTIALIDKIRELADEGLTFRVIGTRLGISRSRVSQLACGAGIASKRDRARQKP